MIIRNLYSLFCGSELQKGRLDSSIPPSEIVEKENTAVIIPRQFKDDVERLCNYCGVELKSRLCIEIELSELLEILPRERRRKEAYCVAILLYLQIGAFLLIIAKQLIYLSVNWG